MYCRLNEQEVMDCICVAAAQELDCDVTEVDIKEVRSLADGNIIAEVQQVGRMFNRDNLDLNDIMDGIVGFYVEFHCFNPQAIVVKSVNNDRDGLWAEVTVGEY